MTVALKSLFFTLLALTVATMLLPWLVLLWSGGVPELTLTPWLLGVVPWALGFALFLWSNGAFTFVGRGTLAPMVAPVFLVRAGPYRLVRNPMYVALFLMIGGEVLFFHSLALLIFWLLLMAFVHTYVVLVEERMLRRQFGESYEAYLRSVPRWFPRLLREPGVKVQ